VTYTFGLDTFGDRNGDADGKPLSHAETIRNVAEEGVLAEQAGVDFFGIGEHHTGDFPMTIELYVDRVIPRVRELLEAD